MGPLDLPTGKRGRLGSLEATAGMEQLSWFERRLPRLVSSWTSEEEMKAWHAQVSN